MMSPTNSSEEVRKQFIDSFGEESGELAHWLWSDIARLHMNWNNYEQLYGTDEDTVDLLNHIASSFFFMTERVLRHDIVMRICRITDPAFSDRAQSRSNASLRQLSHKLCESLPSELIAKLESALSELDELSKPVRDLRNKRIAHSDFEAVLLLRSEPLPGVSRQQMRDILSKIRECYSLLEHHFLDSETSFEHVIQANDASKLVHHLRQARAYQDIERTVLDNRMGRKR